MDSSPIKPRKKVSRRVIVFAIVVLSPLLISGILFLGMQLVYWPIRAEITRIAQVSGIKPLSVECNSGIDIGIICQALYNELPYDMQSKMLTSSGYTVIESNPIGGSSYMAARNSKVHIYATASSGYQVSGYVGKTNITYQFNDHLN